jgi:hypothetical protein
MRGARRGGYHSEGYFSSDQEEDLRGRSDFFVKKFKNLEKGKFKFSQLSSCVQVITKYLGKCQP